MSDAAAHSKERWEEFFARTGDLPPKERTRSFLDRLPQDAHVLDFGCGSGRWATAFLRDRPDISIDLLDQHVDKANLLPPGFRGEKFQTDFRDFKPQRAYDGIWAFAALFFLPRERLEATVHTLAGALKPQGIMMFTMVDDCPAAAQARFTGMNKETIEALLLRESLKPLFITPNDRAEYGPEKLKILTFHVWALKEK